MPISDDGLVLAGSGINPDGLYQAWYANLRPDTSLLAGDYNGNGTVEQADLDLVLLHWGAAAAPTSWTDDLPTGAIDQSELDVVLLKWGITIASLAPSTARAAVPEPGTAALLLIGLGGLAGIRRRNRLASRSPA